MTPAPAAVELRPRNRRRLTTGTRLAAVSVISAALLVWGSHNYPGAASAAVRLPSGGTHVTRLVERANDVAFSPDGRLLALTVGNELWVARTDGSSVHEVLRHVRGNPTPNPRPVWSPDSIWLAFQDFGTDNRSHIYLVRRDGSERRQLTAADVDDFDPAWSPDGQLIVFDRAYHQLWTVHPDGRGLRYFHPGVEPTWSPDGRHVAYLGKPCSTCWTNFNLHVVDAHGGNARTLTHGSTSPGDPVWSPDGRWISLKAQYWVPAPAGEKGRVVASTIDLVSPKTSTRATIFRSPQGEVTRPTWSTNSRRIAFSDSARLEIMNADGSHVHPFAWSKP